MKSKWFALGCLTSILIVCGIIYFSLISLNKLGKDFTGTSQLTKVNPGSYLHLKLSGSLIPYNEYEEGYFNKAGVSVHELVSKIDLAAKDDNINGIFLEPQFISAGYADLNEITTALSRFRASGKQVISYLEFALNKDYFLASASDRIYLNPSASAGIVLTGVGGNVLFYKDLFDKIGFDVTVISAGKYKGAGETYSRSSFSEPVKQNLSHLFDKIYDSVLNNIAENRKLSRKDIDYLFENRDNLFINQNYALEHKLADELSYRDDVLNHHFMKNKLVDCQKYQPISRNVSAYKIAVIYAQGTIAPNPAMPSAMTISAEKINKILEDLRFDNAVKAVVLRVNSPGGSALISEVITEKIEQLKQEKPVVVSMGNIAASGGYYISSPADYIYVDPFTITGSIGVVAMFPNVEGLSKKLGINSENLGKGKYVNAFNLYHKPSADEIQAIKLSLTDTYLEFKQRVSSGRNLSLQQVENVAQGQVWSSQDAVKTGLADEVGMLNDAIEKAASLSQTENYQIVYLPERKSYLQELLKKGFELDVAQNIINSAAPTDLKLDEVIHLLENIMNHPVQTILPWQIEP